MTAFKASESSPASRRTSPYLACASPASRPECGAYITMNPGYLGRAELPEGVKALFRPMTVMKPDLVLICENFLMAEGFTTAKVRRSFSHVCLFIFFFSTPARPHTTTQFPH